MSVEIEIKYFNTLEAWRIEGGANSGPANTSSTKKEGFSEPITAATESDDLPF